MLKMRVIWGLDSIKDQEKYACAQYGPHTKEIRFLTSWYHGVVAWYKAEQGEEANRIQPSDVHQGSFLSFRKHPPWFYLTTLSKSIQ